MGCFDEVRGCDNVQRRPGELLATEAYRYGRRGEYKNDTGSSRSKTDSMKCNLQCVCLNVFTWFLGVEISSLIFLGSGP